MPLANTKLIVFLKIVIIFFSAGILTFFVSILAGVDFIKDRATINKLGEILSEISTEIDGGINKRIFRLGQAPATKSYKQVYCVGLARELLDIYYIAEKPKIVLGTRDEVDYQRKSTLILGYATERNLTKLIDEIIPLTMELQNAHNLIKKTQEKSAWKETAYIILYFALFVFLYVLVFYRYRIIFHFKDRRTIIDRRVSSIDRRIFDSPQYIGRPERRKQKDRRKGGEKRINTLYKF